MNHEYVRLSLSNQEFDLPALEEFHPAFRIPSGLKHAIRALLLIAALSVCFRKCNNAGTYDPDTCPTPTSSISEDRGLELSSVVVYEAPTMQM